MSSTLSCTIELITPQNAFSEFFQDVDSLVNYFELFVSDILHEWELGSWLSLLRHLIRILNSLGEDKVQEFNRRFRSMPTFGRSTIRKFRTHVSDLKQCAARDYEDILQVCSFEKSGSILGSIMSQCAIPCFEGMLDPENDRILNDLLFTCNAWHSNAKSRLHTD